MHWELPVGAVRAVVPSELEIDTFEDKAYAGVVAFTMRDVSPWWSPSVPGISNFHETNVRTYVHRGGVPGVWFMSLDAASTIAVGIARAGWDLPYHRATMEVDVGETRARYASKRRFPKPLPADLEVEAELGAAIDPPRDGSFEHFLVERYVLFAKSGERLRKGVVHHRPYPLRSAKTIRWRSTLIEAAGMPSPSGEPHALFSPGVDVDVYALREA